MEFVKKTSLLGIKNFLMTNLSLNERLKFINDSSS